MELDRVSTVHCAGGNGNTTMTMVRSRLALSMMIALAAIAPAWAAAPTEQVARACRLKAIQAHPTKPAGSEQGSAQAQRDYFRECVERMEEAPLALTEEERSVVLNNVRPQGGSTLGLGAISEGADVPRGVNLAAAFPKAVVERVPKLAAYRYFTAENVIAVVRPGTSKVILVIEGR